MLLEICAEMFGGAPEVRLAPCVGELDTAVQSVAAEVRAMLLAAERSDAC